MPRVSVLLTCYNHLPYLKVALEGVYAQTCKDFEIVALDDGSTDGSRDFLREEESKGRLKCVFNAKNLGTYATLNVGLELASSEFIAILNDDDLWAPEKLERQIAMMDSNAKIGLVHCGGWFIGGDGKKLADPAPLGFEYPSTPTGDVLGMEILYNHIITSSAVVRKKCFDECGPFDPAFFGSGDWQMWLRICQRFEVGYVDEPLCFYRVHQTNASHMKDKINEDDARIREWITSWQSQFQERSDLQDAFAHNWACLGTERTWKGDRRGGRQAYAKSISMKPGRVKSYVRWLATFLPTNVFRKLS